MSVTTLIPVIAAGAGITLLCVIVGIVEPALSDAVIRRDKVREISDRDLEALQKRRREENSLSRKIRAFLEDYQARHSHHVKNARQEKSQRELAHRLYAAGIAVTPGAYQFVVSVLTVICVIIALFVGLLTHPDYQTFALYLMVGAAAPTILVRYGVSARVTIRQTQMEDQLPDVLDLLAISVGAGMGFDQALNFITESMEGPLINELRVLGRELSLGKSRSQAFADMGRNSNSAMIINFCSAVVQAIEMGIPLHDMLVAQATAARNEHVAKVRTKAARASIRMLLPMVAFIFPVLFIVLMGPAVMNVLDSGIL